MKRTLKLFSLLLSVLISIEAAAQQKPYNAYYLAKQLVELENQLKTAHVDSMKNYETSIKRIIPYVLGYAELDAFDHALLFDKLKPYPDLYSLAGYLIGAIDYKAYVLNADISALPDTASFTEIRNLKDTLQSKRQRFQKFSFDDAEQWAGERELTINVTPLTKADSLTESDLIAVFNGNYAPCIRAYEKTLLCSLNQKLETPLKLPAGTTTPTLSADFDKLRDDISKGEGAAWKNFVTQKINHWRDSISTRIAHRFEEAKRLELKSMTDEIIGLIDSLDNDAKVKLIDHIYQHTTAKVHVVTDTNKATVPTIGNLQAQALALPTVAIPSGSIAFKLPSETEMINAMAIYLASRVKQEAVLWFFDQLRKRAETEALFRTAFPETIRLLMTDETYEVPNMGTAWRYALSKDFVTMPDNFVESDWLEERLAAKNAAYLHAFLQMSLEIKRHLSAKLSYRDMIRQLYIYTLNETATTDETVKYGHGLVKLLYAFSNELNQVDTAENQTLRVQGLTFEQLTNMRSREMAVMLSLLNMKYGDPLGSMFENWADGFDREKANRFAAWIGRIQINLNQFDNVLNAIHAAELPQTSEATKVEFSYYNVYSLLSNLLSGMIPTFDQPDGKRIDLTKINRGIELINGMNEVYHLMAQKNYAGGVQQLIGLFNYAAYELPRGTALPQETMINTMQESEINDMLTDNVSFTYIRKFAAFLNDVAEAKGEEQLAKVIKSYTLPAGSYKRKRNVWASLDVNAYVGGYAGMESLGKLEFNKASLATYGLSAPIGISYSWGTRKDSATAKDIAVNGLMYRPGNYDKRKSKKGYKQLTGNATTLFFSMVDLGTYMSFRFKGESDVEHEVYWKQFISPGVFIMKGIRNTPLAGTLGLQYIPQFRAGAQGVDKPSDRMNTWRVQAALLFDIPLFNLHTRTTR